MPNKLIASQIPVLDLGSTPRKARVIRLLGESRVMNRSRSCRRHFDAIASLRISAFHSQSPCSKTSWEWNSSRMEFEQNGTLGMDFINTSTAADHQSQQQSQPSPMQLNNNVSDPSTSTAGSHHMPHVSTLPLHHLDHSAASLSPVGRTMFAASQVNTMFSQDSGTNDDVFFGGHSGATMRTMPSPNMAIGDMASFANSLPEESQYLEQLLTHQVK